MSINDRPIVHHHIPGEPQNFFGGGDMHSGKMHFGNLFNEAGTGRGAGSHSGMWNFGQSSEAASHGLQKSGILPGLHFDGHWHPGKGGHGWPESFQPHHQGHSHYAENTHAHSHGHGHSRIHHGAHHETFDGNSVRSKAHVEHGGGGRAPESARPQTDQAQAPAAPDSAAGKPLPASLEQVSSTIGNSSAQHTKSENALAIGAAVVKEARKAGLDDKTAARLAERFVAAGLTETMTSKTDGSLNNREKSDYHHGVPTSFGFLQLHDGGQKSEDVVGGRYVKSQMSAEQAFTPNAAIERSFHHFMQQHPDLSSNESIKNTLIRSQAAGDGRYQNKFDDHLPTAKQLLANAGFYRMLGSGNQPQAGDR